MATTQAPPGPEPGQRRPHRGSASAGTWTATATEGADRPGGPKRGTGRRRRERPPGGGRLVLVEIAVVCILLTLVRPVWWLFLLDGLVLVALVLGLTRVSGQWWVQRLGQRWRFRRRRIALAGRRATPAADETADSAALVALAGHLRLRTIEHRGVSVGVAEDARGWFATIALSPPPDLRADPPATPLRRHLLASLLDDRTTAPTLVQVVTHTVPAPTVQLAGGVPAVWAYRTKLDGRPFPAVQTSWVSVRLDAADAARVASSHGGGVEAVARAVAAMAVRAGRSLQAAGVAGRVLDEAGIRSALSRSCVPGDSAGEAPQERWTGWHAQGLAHVCFALSGWPQGRAADAGDSQHGGHPKAGRPDAGRSEAGRSDVDRPDADRPEGGGRSEAGGPDAGRPDADEVLADLCAAPAVATSLALILTYRPTGLATRCLLRVVCPPELLATAADRVTAIARRAGLQVQRLDGRHGPGVYASAPTGGGYR